MADSFTAAGSNWGRSVYGASLGKWTFEYGVEMKKGGVKEEFKFYLDDGKVSGNSIKIL